MLALLASIVIAGPPIDAHLAVLRDGSMAHAQRWQAATSLAEAGRAAVPGLIAALADDQARYFAVRALARIGPEAAPAAVPALGAALANRAWAPRRYAAIALGRLGHADALPVLTAALDDVSAVSEDVRWALSQLEGSKTALLSALGADRSGGLAVHARLAARSADRIQLAIELENRGDQALVLPAPDLVLSASLVSLTGDRARAARRVGEEKLYLHAKRKPVRIEPGRSQIVMLSLRVEHAGSSDADKDDRPAPIGRVLRAGAWAVPIPEDAGFELHAGWIAQRAAEVSGVLTLAAGGYRLPGAPARSKAVAIQPP